jgi:cysteinyl-tRNA synthetase
VDVVEVGADSDAVASFVEHMDDDLDTPGALAEIFDLARRAHSALDEGDRDGGRRLALTVAVLCGALGLALGASEAGLDDETAALVADRDRARGAGDYEQADRDRRELEARGWVVEDGPEGTRLRPRPGS